MDGKHQYGFMTAELGLKYRFINIESEDIQIGIFPTFMDIKKLGKFTTYGGAGYWLNPGEDNRNFVFTGWQGQYDFSKTISLGGEIYYQSPDTKDGKSDVAFKLRGLINLNEENHILFSIGHSLKNTDIVSGYLGYQLTI